jgi:predicted DNA-binding transcriptional regulator YafY
MWRDDAPIQVQLLFFGAGARAVQEAQWHPSQTTTPLANDTCLLTFQLTAPQELAPWVLQWGGDVEVIAPADLRATVAARAAQIARRYRTTTEALP